MLNMGTVGSAGVGVEWVGGGANTSGAGCELKPPVGGGAIAGGCAAVGGAVNKADAWPSLFSGGGAMLG